MTTPERHPYEPGEELVKVGRGYGRACRHCGKPANSPRHRSGPPIPPKPPGRRRRARLEELATAESAQRFADIHAPDEQAEPVAPAKPTTRELVLLAHALDAYLELPVGVNEWRVELRARALRQEIELASLESGRPPESEPHVTTLDRLELKPAPIEEVLEAIIIPPEPRVAANVAKSARARARSQVKGIRDSKDRELAVRLLVAGFRIRRTGSGHYLLERGPGEHVSISATTSDHRSWRNNRAAAKRYGVDVEGL